MAALGLQSDGIVRGCPVQRRQVRQRTRSPHIVVPARAGDPGARRCLFGARVHPGNRFIQCGGFHIYCGERFREPLEMQMRIREPGQDAPAVKIDGQDTMRVTQCSAHGRIVSCAVNASAADRYCGGQRRCLLHCMEPAIEENTIAVHLLYELPFQPPNGEIARDADESENTDEVEAELG